MYATLKINSARESKGGVYPVFTTYPGVADLPVMQDAVGGYIETGFRLDSETRKGIQIDFWVNDEGLFISDNPVMQYKVGENVVQLVGPGIFTGADSEGENIELTHEEIDQIQNSVKIKLVGWTE